MKYFFSIAVVLVCAYTNAQTSLGLRTGASTFFYDIPAEDHSSPRFFFSVPWEVPVKRWLSLQPELSIGQRDFKWFDGVTSDLLHRETFNLDFIFCPKIRLKTTKVGMFAEGGVLVGLALLEKRETGHIYSFPSLPLLYDHIYTERRTSSLGEPAIEFGLVGRVGAEYFTSSATLQIGFQFFEGLTAMAEKNVYGSPVRQSSFGIFIGMLTNLKTKQSNQN